MKKSKLLSIIMALAMIMSVIIPFGKSMAAAETYDIVVHKVLFTGKDIVTREGGAVGADGTTKYTGKELSTNPNGGDFKKYFGDGVSVEAVEGVHYEAKQGGVVKAEGKTGPDGTVRFSGLLEGTYVIEENKAKTKLAAKYEGKLPAKSVPVTVTLPVYKADGGKFTNGTDALHIYPKNTIDEPTIKKSVTESGNMNDTAGIGQVKPFIIESTMPEGINEYKVLKFTDQLTSGLTYKGNLVVKKGGAVVNKAANTYKETVTGTKGAKIEIEFAEEYIKTLVAGDKLEITFDSVINEDAVLGKINPNEVELEYGHAPDNTKKKKPEKPELHTGGKRFVKQSKDENNKLLPDAEFVVKKFGKEEYVKKSNTGEISFVNNKNDATRFKSDAQGIIDIKGLPYGDKGVKNETASSEYEIVETKAPAGYALDETAKKFTVNKTSYNENPDVLPLKPVDPEVINNNKVTIPQTGGIGSVIVVAAGILLVGAGLYVKRKNSRA